MKRRAPRPSKIIIFLNIWFFRRPHSRGITLYAKRNSNNFMRLYMGKCRGKIYYTSALRSCQRHGEPDSWVGKGEWRRRKWLPAISTQLQHLEVWITIFKEFLFGDTKYELHTTYVSGKYWENKLPLLGAEQCWSIWSLPWLAREKIVVKFNSLVIFPREIVVK